MHSTARILYEPYYATDSISQATESRFFPFFCATNDFSGMSTQAGAAGTSSSPSTSLAISAFLWGNGTYAICLICSLLFLFGPFLFPRTLGLFVVLPYLSWNLFFKRDELRFGSPWPNFSRNHPGFCCLRRYLELGFGKIPEKLVELDSSDEPQAIFAVSPHGTGSDFRILMDGMLSQNLPNMAPKIRSLAASILFRIPFVREMALWTGCVDARRSVAENLLDAKLSILVVPGGMDEQIRTEHGKEIVYLKNRKGFIKLAMRKRVSVVPVYVFGSSDMFHTSNVLFGARYWILKNLKMCIPIASGLWGSFCPLPVKTTIVMGEPLLFIPKIDGQPNDDELDAAHKAFMTALEKLFDEHKRALGYVDRKLEII